jgi:serine phosphatase RsbU (regulator of sigma subunit)
MIVDDEEIVTSSISSYLEFDTDYDVVAFQSPVEALESLRRRPVDIVVSDYLMPRMTGLEFLAKVKQIYPDAPRILLTGYADKENAIRAINEVGLYQYIEKPWDNDQLRLVIQNGLESRSLKATLTRKIQELDRLLHDQQELVAREGLIRREMRDARHFQQRLLPESLPAAGRFVLNARYLPALEVGGDFYDVLPCGDDRWAVLLADAMGHGIQAALTTALLKFAFACSVEPDRPPGDILRSMNSILRRGLPTGIFVAAAVLQFDSRSGDVWVVNAGLPHPFALRRAAARAERLAVNGMLLCAVADDQYVVDSGSTLRLEPGDRLVMFTDGLTETEGDDGRRFEDDHLVGLLDREATGEGDLLETMISAVGRFRRSATREDDLTIISIENNGS